MTGDIGTFREILVLLFGRLSRHGAGLVLALGLAGCATSGGITDGGDALVSPNKYAMYNCPDLTDRVKAVRARQVELEQVMDRASQGAGGELINAIAYRTEYAQTRGELRLLAKAEEERQCAVQSDRASGRAVF